MSLLSEIRKPSSLRRKRLLAVDIGAYLRIQKPLTWVLGPKYERSRRSIEIDITWDCNLRCYSCNRSCQQAPTDEHMTVKQIRKFVDESWKSNIHWEKIRVTGGEPTLHPDFFEILDVLLTSPHTQIEIVTNGHGSKVAAILSRIPPAIDIENSHKQGIAHDFMSFNVAPVDSPAYRFADFRNGCWIPSHCGIGLTPYGYYPCAVAGGIDRIVGFDIGRKQIPSPDDNMHDLLKRFCPLCGCFKRIDKPYLDRPLMSLTWEVAYSLYFDSPPKLILF